MAPKNAPFSSQYCFIIVAAALVLLSSRALAQFPTIRYTATASSLQLPRAQDISSSVSFRYRTATPLLGATNFILVTPSAGAGPARIAIGLNPNVVPYLAPGS
jgi:hypothetical protein